MSICDGMAYINKQTSCLIDHLQHGNTIIIGGMIFGDNILTTLFPGYKANSQYTILKDCLIQQPDTTLNYFMHAKDLIQDKQLGQKYCSFEKVILKHLKQLTEIQPKTDHIQVHIILLDDFIPPPAYDFAQSIHQQGRTSQFIKPGYPITPLTGYICSYQDDPLMLQYAKDPYVIREQLPLAPNLGLNHPLRLVQMAYKLSEHTAIPTSKLTQYITDRSPRQYNKISHTLIQDALKTEQKLLISGHSDEDEIERLEFILNTFQSP